MRILPFLEALFTPGIKPFWSSVGSALGSVFGSSLGNKLFGKSEGSQKRERRREQAYGLEQIKLGNQMDLANQKEMFDYRINAATDAGLTNVEAFGSPAAGAGGGTTGSGNTLGNMASSQAVADRQMDQQREAMYLKAGTDLAATHMQTQAQRDVADIQADTADKDRTTRELIAGNQLALDTRQLQEIAIPDLANKTGLNEQQIKVAINEAANTDPAWVRKKTVMQLGVDNGIQNLILGRLNLDLTNPDQIANLTDEQYNDALTALLSAASGTGKTAEAVKSIFERIFKFAADQPTNPVELPDWLSGKPSLGKPNPQGGFPAPKGVLGRQVPRYSNYNQDFPNR